MKIENATEIVFIYILFGESLERWEEENLIITVYLVSHFTEQVTCSSDLNKSLHSEGKEERKWKEGERFHEILYLLQDWSPVPEMLTCASQIRVSGNLLKNR